MFFIYSTTFVVIITMFQVPVGNTIRLSNEDDSVTTERDPLDEWHMDYVPSGYLPDSVYRELAWFGILQVQPLYRSTKHKVAARWVWQNTLGRPHVVMENSQTAQTEETLGHQALIEESAKWAQEQRMAQEVLMENIRFGGNGLTVRTVISTHKKTVYIIQNGKYYSCGEGSEPDVDAFRTQPNIHERKCTNDKEPVPLPLGVDPCIDAEHTPLEYSSLSQWMFCLGDGEREDTNFADGDLDCGKKIKMRFSDFLKECAVDKNVVISYEYYGDEPRKDMVHNTTICTSWDPCRIAYLYRIEVPEIPQVPTTTPDPCDTTICEDCREETVEPELPVAQLLNADKANLSTLFHRGDGLSWMNTSAESFPTIKERAFPGGYLATGERIYPIRCEIDRSSGFNGTVRGGYYVENETMARVAYYRRRRPELSFCKYFEVIITKQSAVDWLPLNECVEENLVMSREGERTFYGTSYVSRFTVDGNLLPANYLPNMKYSETIKYADPPPPEVQEYTDFEVLCKYV